MIRCWFVVLQICFFMNFIQLLYTILTMGNNMNVYSQRTKVIITLFANTLTDIVFCIVINGVVFVLEVIDMKERGLWMKISRSSSHARVFVDLATMTKMDAERSRHTK